MKQVCHKHDPPVATSAAAAAAVCLPALAKDDWLTGPHRCAAGLPPSAVSVACLVLTSDTVDR